MVCSSLSCLCLGGSPLGHLPAPFCLQQLPDEFDLPCAIVEGGWAEAAWTHEARGHWDKRPWKPSSLQAARTCSNLRVLLFLYVDFVLGVISHSSKTSLLHIVYA